MRTSSLKRSPSFFGDPESSLNRLAQMSEQQAQLAYVKPWFEKRPRFSDILVAKEAYANDALVLMDLSAMYAQVKAEAGNKYEFCFNSNLSALLNQLEIRLRNCGIPLQRVRLTWINSAEDHALSIVRKQKSPKRMSNFDYDSVFEHVRIYFPDYVALHNPQHVLIYQQDENGLSFSKSSRSLISNFTPNRIVLISDNNMLLQCAQQQGWGGIRVYRAGELNQSDLHHYWSYHHKAPVEEIVVACDIDDTAVILAHQMHAKGLQLNSNLVHAAEAILQAHRDSELFFITSRIDFEKTARLECHAVVQENINKVVQGCELDQDLQLIEPDSLDDAPLATLKYLRNEQRKLKKKIELIHNHEHSEYRIRHALNAALNTELCATVFTNYETAVKYKKILAREILKGRKRRIVFIDNSEIEIRSARLFVKLQKEKGLPELLAIQVMEDGMIAREEYQPVLEALVNVLLLMDKQLSAAFIRLPKTEDATTKFTCLTI